MNGRIFWMDFLFLMFLSFSLLKLYFWGGRFEEICCFPNISQRFSTEVGRLGTTDILAWPYSKAYIENTFCFCLGFWKANPR